MHIGKPPFRAIMIKRQTFVIQAEHMQNRGMQIVNRADILDGFVAKLIRGAVAESAFHAGTGEPHGEAMRIMVSATRIFLEGRHATEFRIESNERVAQEPALFQIRH